jgi:hypothetical protein
VAGNACCSVVMSVSYERQEMILFCTASRPALGLTQSTVQTVRGGGLHSPVCLHGVVLNYLSTGTTSLFYQCHNLYIVGRAFIHVGHAVILSLQVKNPR